MSAAIDTDDKATHGRAGTCIMVFARSPVPGQCKNRLIPALGEQGAARLHEKLVRRALEAACEARPEAVQLWCTPDATHPFFAAGARDYPIVLESQSGNDLGERMHHALEFALRRHAKALLIGSDIPDIDATYLRAATEALDHAPAVFGPAEDGGYVLVGLNEPAEALFEGIDWGGPQVMAQTRDRLRRLGWQAAELATLWDLDRPEDLARLGR